MEKNRSKKPRRKEGRQRGFKLAAPVQNEGVGAGGATKSIVNRTRTFVKQAFSVDCRANQAEYPAGGPHTWSSGVFCAVVVEGLCDGRHSTSNHPLPREAAVLCSPAGPSNRKQEGRAILEQVLRAADGHVNDEENQCCDFTTMIDGRSSITAVFGSYEWPKVPKRSQERSGQAGAVDRQEEETREDDTEDGQHSLCAAETVQQASACFRSQGHSLFQRCLGLCASANLHPAQAQKTHLAISLFFAYVSRGHTPRTQKVSFDTLWKARKELPKAYVFLAGDHDLLCDVMGGRVTFKVYEVGALSHADAVFGELGRTRTRVQGSVATLSGSVRQVCSPGGGKGRGDSPEDNVWTSPGSDVCAGSSQDFMKNSLSPF